MTHKTLPILYSFRRCPYAMRARMALIYSGVQVELREVELKNKPIELLNISHKATVPVLQHLDGTILDESRDIMHWALQQHDPENWLNTANHRLIDDNDDDFKMHLDHYKYADRFPAHSAIYYQAQCDIFLEKLEKKLKNTKFIENMQLSYADFAIFPFIRQYYFVNIHAFDKQKYTHINTWLAQLLAHPIFLQSMQKYSPWKPEDKPVTFPISFKE